MTLLITPPHGWQDKNPANSMFDVGWKRDGIGNVGKLAFTNSMRMGGECCLLCAARNNPSQWTMLLSLASSFDTVRVIVQLVQAAKAGDADACSMSLRALSWPPAGQRATIAMLALASLDEDDAAHVVEATLRTAGFPLSDLVAPMAAARQWAEWASRAERTLVRPPVASVECAGSLIHRARSSRAGKPKQPAGSALSSCVAEWWSVEEARR